jgi:hypothetical protein
MMWADPNGRITTALTTFMGKFQEVTTATGAALRPQVYSSLFLLAFLLAVLVGIHFVIVFIEVLNEQSYDFRLVLR